MDNSVLGPTELTDGIENSTFCSSDPPNNTQAAVKLQANDKKRPSSIFYSRGSSFETPQNKKKNNERGQLKSVSSHATRAWNSITEACSKGMDKKGSSAAPDGVQRDNSTGAFCDMLYHEVKAMGEGQRQITQFKLYRTLMEVKFGYAGTTVAATETSSTCSPTVVTFPTTHYNDSWSSMLQPTPAFSTHADVCQVNSMDHVSKQFSAIYEEERDFNTTTLSTTRMMFADANDTLFRDT